MPQRQVAETCTLRDKKNNINVKTPLWWKTDIQLKGYAISTRYNQYRTQLAPAAVDTMNNQYYKQPDR